MSAGSVRPFTYFPFSSIKAISPSSGTGGLHAASVTTGLGNSSPAQTGRGSQVLTAEPGDLHHHALANHNDHELNWREKYVVASSLFLLRA